MQALGAGWMGRVGDRRVASLTLRGLFLAALALTVLVPRAGDSYWTFPAVSRPWTLAPFAALFAIVLLDLGAPRSLRNLDVLALLTPYLGLALWTPTGEWQLALVYAPLVYLFARMLALAVRGGLRRSPHRRSGPLTCTWLALGVLVLVAVHVEWTLGSRVSSDIARASVHGARALVHGRPVYGDENALARQNEGLDPHLDSYGPLAYEAVVPFLAVARGTGPAQAAALFFDLLSALLLLVLGRRMASLHLGLTLALAWLAFPFSLYVAEMGANDALLCAGLLATLLWQAEPARRGAALAAAAWSKLSPLALLPLLLAHDAGRRSRARFAASFAVVSALCFLPILVHDSPSTFLDRTFGFQLSRAPGYSIWELLDGPRAATGLHTLGAVVHGLLDACAVTLALALPRLGPRRDTAGLAAASAALLIALVSLDGYFSFAYLCWFAPLVLVADAIPRPHARPANARRVRARTRDREAAELPVLA